LTQRRNECAIDRHRTVMWRPPSSAAT